MIAASDQKWRQQAPFFSGLISYPPKPTRLPAIDARHLHGLISIALMLTYFIYILLTLRASKQLVEDGHGTEADEKIFLARIGLPENRLTILMQLILGLSLLMLGAKGFINGAMVFQGTLLPAIGIMLTPWQPRIEVLGCVAITLIAAAWRRLNTRSKGLPLWVLLVNGGLYLFYLGLTLG